MLSSHFHRHDTTVASSEGASAVEYAILVSLIAVVIVIAVAVVGTNVKGLYQRTADCQSAPENCK